MLLLYLFCLEQHGRVEKHGPWDQADLGLNPVLSASSLVTWEKYLILLNLDFFICKPW